MNVHYSIALMMIFDDVVFEVKSRYCNFAVLARGHIPPAGQLQMRCDLEL